MKAKMLEIRDAGTFISMLCVDMNPDNDFGDPHYGVNSAQRYLLRRVGYPCDGLPNILMTPASGDGDRATNDPHYWNDRTRMTAHHYIIDHWHELSDGDVIDVEFILGEKSTRKISERHTTGEA